MIIHLKKLKPKWKKATFILNNLIKFKCFENIQWYKYVSENLSSRREKLVDKKCMDSLGIKFKNAVLFMTNEIKFKMKFIYSVYYETCSNLHIIKIWFVFRTLVYTKNCIHTYCKIYIL